MLSYWLETFLEYLAFLILALLLVETCHWWDILVIWLAQSSLVQWIAKFVLSVLFVCIVCIAAPKSFTSLACLISLYALNRFFMSKFTATHISQNVQGWKSGTFFFQPIPKLVHTTRIWKNKCLCLESPAR